MNRIPYIILTGIPGIGKAVESAINPFWIHAGTSALELFSEDERYKIQAYREKHPDEIITKRLLRKILNDP